MVYVQDQGFAIRMLSYEPDPLVDPSPEGRDVYRDSCLEAYLNFGQENKYLNVEVNSVGRNCQEFGLP
ncbi:MAG: hypothetical protein MJ219_00340 [Mycoplasmoidaceae bacterium]|nr:hypothetical protein [Mycoplasmoidaceae bacterium]